MKFKFIKTGCKDVGVYDLRDISTNDIVEISGYFEEKAKNNPDFEIVKTKKAGKKHGYSSSNTEQGSI